MAAPLRIPSRSGQREEPDSSADSSGTTRTPALTVSSVSPDLPVSLGQVTEPPPGKNLWEQICEEYEAELPPFPEGYKVKQEAPAADLPLEEVIVHGFHAEHYLPAPPITVTSHIPCPSYKLEAIDPKTCSPREYLETFVFPVLLPGMASLLHQAKREKCFEVLFRLWHPTDGLLPGLIGNTLNIKHCRPPECGMKVEIFKEMTKETGKAQSSTDPESERWFNCQTDSCQEPEKERKRTKFLACDFLTEWLYNHNPKRTGEPFTEFFSIPFVAEWLKQHPRPPIMLSLLLTEEEAAICIQAFWRAYLVRCDPEIQELRQWQKKLREDKYIRQRVRMFWTKQELKVKCKMEEEEEAAVAPLVKILRP